VKRMQNSIPVVINNLFGNIPVPIE